MPPAKKPESKLLAKVQSRLRELRAHGERVKWVKYHGNAFSQAGTPDLHVTWGGVSLWLELKGPDGVVSALQQQELRDWEAAGAIARVVRSLDDLEAALEEARLRLRKLPDSQLGVAFA